MVEFGMTDPDLGQLGTIDHDPVLFTEFLLLSPTDPDECIPRTNIMVPNEGPYMSSYKCLILTIALSCTAFEI